MPQPAPGEALKPIRSEAGRPEKDEAGKAANGPGPAEFDQLREILLGPERAQIQSLEERLGNPEKRGADLAEALPYAVRSARTKALREAMEPIFEKAFEASVRKHPKELADAIYPVIGPAIRNSIGASIREFAENLNQIVEKSASWRAISWRIEAKVTGKPFTELLLARSLLYRVEQVFLIHRKSGLLLQHVAAEAAILKDADMVSGMLTAIQDFFSDSFTQSGQDLETIDTGRFKLWIQYGPRALVVGAVSGTAPAELKTVFRSAVDQVHQQFYAQLDAKQSDISVYEPARPMLEACLLGQSAVGKRKRHVVARWAAAFAILALGALILYRARQISRWDAYFSRLRAEPGVLVTSIEKRPPGYLIVGMKDPKAVDPSSLLRGRGLDEKKVEFVWYPFLSMDTPFAKEREREDAVKAIERQLIRFDVGSPKLQLAEADKIAEIVETLRRWPDMRIDLNGRADETGSAAMNNKLSIDRAENVKRAIMEQGVDASRIELAGLGNGHPLRTGESDWARADNRSVAAHVR